MLVDLHDVSLNRNSEPRVDSPYSGIASVLRLASCVWRLSSVLSASLCIRRSSLTEGYSRASSGGGARVWSGAFRGPGSA